jgi:biopolymer transport protein TolQ
MTAEGVSVLGLVADAGPVVRVVMALLLLASVVSWAMIVDRIRVYLRARKAGSAFQDRFWSGADLSSLYTQVKAEPDENAGPERIFQAGFHEFVRLAKSSRDADAVMEGAQRAMRVALQREQSRLNRHLPFLASVGSTSPYVGLFGTVWGIMNAFMALSHVSQATLAAVAPGIAEALIATAIGLFAAIPAVLAYNRFATLSDELVGESELFAEEFSSLLHRRAHAQRQG